MARQKRASKEVLEIIHSIPTPTTEDIEKCKIAVLTCWSVSEVADFMGADPLVISHWINNHVYFRAAFLTWRDHATVKVEQSLAKRAIGFTKKSKKQALTKTGQVVELINEEYYPPSETAAALWLKNRNKEDWKDTQHIDVNVQTDIRAWLITAMGEERSDDMLDVTPRALEAPSIVGNQPLQPIIEMEAEVLETNSERDLGVASLAANETESEPELETESEAVPAALTPLDKAALGPGPSWSRFKW